MKIWRNRISQLLNEAVTDDGVSRTVPATPRQLINSASAGMEDWLTRRTGNIATSNMVSHHRKRKATFQ